MGFEIIDISGDAGIRVVGEDLKELFKSAGEGMYSLITDISGIEPRQSVRTSLSSHSTEGLLVGWLNELIFYFDAYGFIGKEIEIKELSDKTIDAIIRGEEFDTSRHERRLLIKAATYHNLKIIKEDSRLKAEVIFDI
jgi:SHS2 domain-containing protein